MKQSAADNLGRRGIGHACDTGCAARLRIRYRVLVSAALAATALVMGASAQEGGGERLAAPAPHAAGAAGREASRWDLPRLFYEPRQRRGLDAQDRALHLGLASGSTPAGGPRFDGWLAGPTGTHAWVSGGRYVADKSGRLHAADERAADTAAGGLEDGSARLDPARGVLVVHRESEGTVRLRVGEADAPVEGAPAAAATTPALAPGAER